MYFCACIFLFFFVSKLLLLVSLGGAWVLSCAVCGACCLCHLDVSCENKLQFKFQHMHYQSKHYLVVIQVLSSMLAVLKFVSKTKHITILKTIFTSPLITEVCTHIFGTYDITPQFTLNCEKNYCREPLLQGIVSILFYSN